MRVYRVLALVFAILFLAACSSTGSQNVSTSGVSAPSDAERQAILEQQQALAAERARQQEQARQAEEQRLAEARAAEQRAEEERLARERAAQEAERQRQMAARRAAEQARIVAAQQERIKELRDKIAANEAETGNMEAANAVLRQAVSKAEELTDALMVEEEKYNNTDPATGQPVEALATERLQALADEVENLNQQAESLMAQP